MSFMELIWIFFLISALQPMFQQRLIEIRRMRHIDKMQRERGSRVILLVHRQETMRLLGFPLVRYIDVHDSEAVLRAVQETPDDVPVDVILHTPGGLVLAALQIARALEAHPAKVTVHVPHYAMSGGTLVSLAADEIVMCSHSVLGPIDPQINNLPAASILKVVADKPVAEVDDQTLILADVSAKAMDQLTTAATRLLEKHMDTKKARALAKKLATGTWTHDYPISAEEAKDMGLPVTVDMPQDVLDMMKLYPQPVRQSGGVEYIPLPDRKAGR